MIFIHNTHAHAPESENGFIKEKLGFIQVNIPNKPGFSMVVENGARYDNKNPIYKILLRNRTVAIAILFVFFVVVVILTLVLRNYPNI